MNRRTALKPRRTNHTPESISLWSPFVKALKILRQVPFSRKNQSLSPSSIRLRQNNQLGNVRRLCAVHTLKVETDKLRLHGR